MSPGGATIRRVDAALPLSPAQRRTLEGLIGTGDRPVFPADLVPRIRRRLEEAVRAAAPPEPIWLGKSNLADLDRCPGLFDAVRAGERGPFAFSDRFAAGRLAHKAIELEVAGRAERDPHELAEASVERLLEDPAFAAYWQELDELRRDEVLMEAAKTLELFRSTMPPLRLLRRRLAPCTEWPVRVELADGALVLAGTLDLVLGRPTEDDPTRAARLAIDLKTGRAWPEHAEDMRFYALLLALRFGVPIGEIHRQLRGISSDRAIGFGANKVLSVPDAIAQAIELHEREKLGIQQDLWGGAEPVAPEQAAAAAPSVAPASVSEALPGYDPATSSFGTCPECQSQLEFAEGCAKCHVCGYSECS